MAKHDLSYSAALHTDNSLLTRSLGAIMMSMQSSVVPQWDALISEMLVPLKPFPTEEEVSLQPLPQVEAVLFDIYGTILISGSGDIGTAQEHDTTSPIEALLESSGYDVVFHETGDRVATLIKRFITHRHQELKNRGVDHPEVDIRNIWKNVIDQLAEDGLIDQKERDKDVRELAMRHELMVNPVWPMPGFPEIIRELKSRGYPLGIVSNAQFYTPILLEYFAEKTLENLGFQEDYCAWSYELNRAKPSPKVFLKPLERLKMRGIPASRVLYVGNDMLNDVTAATKAGCLTALFAGDMRSFRPRVDHPDVSAKPDVVITELGQLATIL